ncbi:MAG: hypothetical protein H6765_04090 [Candidatus Peribacteria bacterium]|nr:MAG: hypothetical protein H6765_04090 [Candidatus Peribacteria bacterium]
MDGRLVCLDITNGDKNITQAKQVFAEDMDGNGTLDIITNADGEIKVFY